MNLFDNDGICAYLIDGAKIWLDSADAEMRPICLKQHRDNAEVHISMLAFDIRDNYALAQGMIAGIAGPLHLLAFSSDACYEVLRKDELETRDTRPLQDRFEAGDTTIKEAVNSVVLFEDGHMLEISQPYTRNTETGNIDWEELRIGRDGEDIGGRIPDVMRTVMDIIKAAEAHFAAE